MGFGDIDNDTRGWIMCAVSGLACIVGASIICVDLFVQLLPFRGARRFRIQNSNVFLASSLSLSFGVMIFTALYSMLPTSKKYLLEAEFSSQAAGFTMLGCFVAGFFGIQIVSRIVHQSMPSHVVDCDHSHADPSAPPRTTHDHSSSRRSAPHAHVTHSDHTAAETTPLLHHDALANGHSHASSRTHETAPASERLPHSSHAAHSQSLRRNTEHSSRRPMVQVQQRVISFVKDQKSNCDETGSCYGFSDPCGQECYKHLDTIRQNGNFPGTTPSSTATNAVSEVTPSPPRMTTSTLSEHDEVDLEAASCCSSTPSLDTPEGHHHHVPKNAFLALGLQTSIAIALHKFPEGFITYATNHANPRLGFNVFVTLFIHNITEGFAMALPLYLALGSRLRAMGWSAVLGGLSQPFGAAIAALWFRLANHTPMAPNSVVYACLFAVTAGIMVSVGLQLFAESLTLNHDRNLSICSAFLGMCILGVSNALMSSH